MALPYSLAEQNGDVTVMSPLFHTAMRIMLIGDWHATDDDARGEAYKEYSRRMAQWPHPLAGLSAMLADAGKKKCDLVLLLGDMISFPTELGAELVRKAMAESPVPCCYIAGNHDWHYEGMPGHETDLRREWTAKRLRGLYQGRDPLNYSVMLNGVKILMIDNSVYQILPEQLAWLKQELSDGVPAVLGMHIPLYCAELHPSVTGACGHPEWGAASDPYWEIERRERWPESGNTPVTMEFVQTVWEAPNVLGIVAGHNHRFALAAQHAGKFQIEADSARNRSHILTLEPTAVRGKISR